MKIAPRFFNVRWREIEKDERKIREFINKNVTSLFQAAKSLRVCLSLFFQNSVWTFLFSFHVQVFTTLREKKTKKKNNLIFFSFSHFEMRSDPLTFSSLIDIKGGKITRKKGTGWQEGGHKMAAHQTNKHTYPSPLEINSKRWRDTISRFFFFLSFWHFRVGQNGQSRPSYPPTWNLNKTAATTTTNERIPFSFFKKKINK